MSLNCSTVFLTFSMTSAAGWEAILSTAAWPIIPFIFKELNLGWSSLVLMVKSKAILPESLLNNDKTSAGTPEDKPCLSARAWGANSMWHLAAKLLFLAFKSTDKPILAERSRFIFIMSCKYGAKEAASISLSSSRPSISLGPKSIHPDRPASPAGLSPLSSNTAETLKLVYKDVGGRVTLEISTLILSTV